MRSYMESCVASPIAWPLPINREFGANPCWRRQREAARILEEQGHLAQVCREDNELLIDEFSCPFPKVAHQDRAICALHVDFVSSLTGSDTRLGQSLMRGDPACTYRLRPTSGLSH